MYLGCPGEIDRRSEPAQTSQVTKRSDGGVSEERPAERFLQHRAGGSSGGPGNTPVNGQGDVLVTDSIRRTLERRVRQWKLKHRCVEEKRLVVDHGFD